MPPVRSSLLLFFYRGNLFSGFTFVASETRPFLALSSILASHACHLSMDNINRGGVDDLFSGLGLLLLWGWVDRRQRFSTHEPESWLRSKRYVATATAASLLACQACQTCINVTSINKIVKYLLISLSYPLINLSHPLRTLNDSINKLREWSAFTYCFFQLMAPPAQINSPKMYLWGQQGTISALWGGETRHWHWT